MEKKPSTVKWYKPSGIHKFFRWLDRRPGPYWLYYLALAVIAGLANHIVAWHEHALPPGEINKYYAATAVFLVFFLFDMDFLFRIIEDSLNEFLPILDVPEDEMNHIRFEFTHLPAITTAIIFWVGAITGLAVAWFIFPSAVEMNQAFPEMELPVFSVSLGVGFIEIYMIMRAFVQTKKAYEGLRKINIFDLNPLYALSRFSAWLLVFLISYAYLLFLLNPSLVESTHYFFVFEMIVLFVLVFSTFWIPIRRVNRILILEKRRLLNDVVLRIETTFKVLHTSIDQHETSRIKEIQDTIQSLMLEKQFIESLRTWPWKPGTVTGLLSLLVLPLLVGIIVEIISRFIH